MLKMAQTNLYISKSSKNDTVIPMTNNICDYSDYDYKTSFESINRQYEHELELSVLKHIFKTHCSNYASILDAGCGFGRLFESYQPYFHIIYYLITHKTY